MNWGQIIVRNIAILFLIIFLGGCQKEDEALYTLQYQVLRDGNNLSTFTLNYLDPSEATVSTGVLGPDSWQSTEYTEVPSGIPIRMELKVQFGSPALVMKVLKNGSVVAEQQVSSNNSQNIISIEL